MKYHKCVSAAGCLLSCLVFGLGWQARAAVPSLEEAKLIFSFQGKGTDLGWDVGVAKGALTRIPAMQNNQVIVTGNSSGSVAAAYFSCHGFSTGSMSEMIARLRTTDPSVINESTTAKAFKILSGLPTEFPIENLDQFVAVALRDDFRSAGSICSGPKLPIVIVAANYEVLDNRRPSGSPFQGFDYKIFNEKNFSVRWKPQYFEALQKERPELLSDYIGKACTDFVDKSMYDLLSHVPYEERLCDLRVMTTGEDMKLAIQASAAEPTYFNPVSEPDLQTLAPFSHPDLKKEIRVAKRSYYGGFVVPAIVQDIRRVRPDLYAFGTGWIPVRGNAQKLLRAWTLVDSVEVSRVTEWWLDITIQPSEEMSKKMLDNREKPLNVRKQVLLEYLGIGEKQSTDCIDADVCRPKNVKKPGYTYPVGKLGEDLPVRRGIKPLL